MEILITTKNVYGKTLIYVVKQEQREAIKTLTKKETIDTYDIRALEKLGFSVLFTASLPSLP
jgi:hypothetical protein